VILLVFALLLQLLVSGESQMGEVSAEDNLTLKSVKRVFVLGCVQ